jgi:ABC-2 type transport system ATP-binding protein
LGYRYLTAVIASAFASRRSEKPLDSRFPRRRAPASLEAAGREQGTAADAIRATDGTGVTSVGGRPEEPDVGMMHEMTTADAPAVAIEGVSHCYGRRQALDDVTFSITPSTFAVLLGLNGAGKSTLFSLITRLYAIQRGHIRVFGRDVGHASSEALRMVGVVFQQRTLDLDLSVIQNLTYHAALHGIGKHDGRARADEVLARVALSDRANDKVRNLSGGQMRRVEIARALLHRPRLLVLDEPTVGLDIKSRADILGYVRRLVVEEGASVLWATHLIDEIADDDDVIVLHHGRVLAHGSVPRVLDAAGAKDIRAAFTRLTQGTDAAIEAS